MAKIVSYEFESVQALISQPSCDDYVHGLLLPFCVSCEFPMWL